MAPRSLIHSLIHIIESCLKVPSYFVYFCTGYWLVSLGYPVVQSLTHSLTYSLTLTHTHMKIHKSIDVIEVWSPLMWLIWLKFDWSLMIHPNEATANLFHDPMPVIPPILSSVCIFCLWWVYVYIMVCPMQEWDEFAPVRLPDNNVMCYNFKKRCWTLYVQTW